MAMVLEDGISDEMTIIKTDARNALLLYLPAVADVPVPSWDVANAATAHRIHIIADIRPITREDS